MNIFIYAVLVFLTLRFSVTLFNFISNPKLGDYRRKFSEKVTIVVRSGKAEQARARLLESIRLQDYENIELRISDDPEIPDSLSQSSYVLWLDEHTSIEKGLINSLVYRTKVFRLSMLSVIPSQRNAGFWANCIFPVGEFVLLNLFPLRAVRLINHPIFSMASGACLFFDAGVYRKFQLQEQLEDPACTVTDVVKLLKQEQLNTDLLLGNRLVSIYQEVNRQDISLFSARLMLSFSNYNVVALLYLLLVVAGPIVLMLHFAPVFYVLPFGLIFLSRIMTSFMASQNVLLNLLLHPLQILGMSALIVDAVYKRLFTSHRHKK